MLRKLALHLLACLALSLCEAQERLASPAREPLAEEHLLELAGWVMGAKAQAHVYGFTGEEIQVLARGFMAAAQGMAPTAQPEGVKDSVDAFLARKLEIRRAAALAQGRAEEAIFFARLADRKEVVRLPSGLAYEIVSSGEGESPSHLDTVVVHYTGRLLSGQVFDTSIGRMPAKFPLSAVIRGWTEGLQKIQKGGTIRLFIPASLGYGETGTANIPPGAALVFEVELLDIVKG